MPGLGQRLGAQQQWPLSGRKLLIGLRSVRWNGMCWARGTRFDDTNSRSPRVRDCVCVCVNPQGFERVLDLLDDACVGLLDKIRAERGI